MNLSVQETDRSFQFLDCELDRFMYTIEMCSKLLQLVLTMLPDAEDIVDVAIPGYGLQVMGVDMSLFVVAHEDLVI